MPLIIQTIAIAFITPMAFAQYYPVSHTTLTLDHIPRSVIRGDRLIFSGKLVASDERTPLLNKTIYIQYDSPYDSTRTLASSITDYNGDFAVSWTAKPKGIDGGTYNLFAKFNGDDENFFSVSKQFQLDVSP